MCVCGRYVLQVLLVFPKATDPQCVAFADAVSRMNLTCCFATTDEDARVSYISRAHSIVIIDTRNRKLFDGLALCKSVVLLSLPAFDSFLFLAER